MVSELKKLRINELYSSLGYENDYPKRDARLLDAVVHEFFKDFAHHNPISTAQVLNPGADLFAITFLEEEDRGERFWPTIDENVPVYPRDRALITNALRQIFIRKKIAVECSKHAKKKLPRDSLTGPPTSSAIKRKKLTIPSDGQPPPSKKPRSKQLAEPKPWKERPQEPDARGCIEYIRSLNPRRDTTDFTKRWLQTKKASWPEEADLRLQFLMHTHSFYISFDHGDLIPISISQGMKKDTQIEELEAHQIKPFHNRISRRIHELTLKLIKEPPLVLRCQDDGVAVQTQKFSRMWSKKEEYWRADSAEFQALGHHESSSKERRKKSAKRKEPVVFPKIFLQDGECPMLGTDNLEAIADSALQFTLAQEDKIAKNDTQHHDGIEKHLGNPSHSEVISDERAEFLNSDDSILVDTRSVPQNSLHTSRRPKSPSSLAMSKEPNASCSGELTLPNTPPATEVKPDTDRVQHNIWLASVSERLGSRLESGIVIDDTSSDDEDHPMEDLSTIIPGVFDRVVQNTSANGNVEMVCISQPPPKKRRILKSDGKIQVSNSHIKDQLAKRSKIWRNPEQIPRDTLFDKQRQGAFEFDVVGENRISGWAPELRDMLSPAEAQKIGDSRQLEDQVTNSVSSEKQSAVNVPVETKYSNEQNGKQNTVEGPVAKAHPQTKAPQIPISGSTRLLPKTKTPLHIAHKNPSINGHRVSSSPRRQKLSVASQPSTSTSKQSNLKASVMTPAQAGKFCQQDTASIAKTGDSYRKIFDDPDKNSGRSWSESSSSPSDQGEQIPHEREVQPARGELLGNWGRTSDLRLEPELHQRLKEIHSSDLSLTSHMARSEEAKSTFSIGLLGSTSLEAPKERRAMNNQSSMSNVTRFVRDMNEFIANVNVVRDAKPLSPSVFQDPVVNESVGQASETFHEVKKDVPRERPVQHQQQAHLQSEIDILPNDLADTIAHEAPPVREAHLNPSNKVPIISTVTSNRTTATRQTTSCRLNEDSLSPALMPVIAAMENLPPPKPASPEAKKPERNEPAPRETSMESSLLNDEAIKASGPRPLDNSSFVSSTATIAQLHSASQAQILESLKQSSRDCQVPVVDSETILPVQGREPRRNGSYNLVPAAIPFSVKPSPEDSPVKQDTKPITEPLPLSDDRRLAPTPRNASVPTLYLLIRDSKGNLNIEDSYPFDAYVKEYTVPEFFDFFSEVSGIPARSFGTLVFRMNFGENRRIKVQRHSGENVWRKMWREVHVEFKDAQEEDPKEMEFDVTVSRVN